jgi:Fe-S cluster biogenesis protein NfuA
LTGVGANSKIEEPMRDQIEAALAKLRPSLQLDGGDVRLLDVSPDGVVRVGLVGRCAGCPMSRMLLKLGIEQRLRCVPEVTRVITVDERDC